MTIITDLKSISDLPRDGYCYLATPYTNYCHGIERAYLDAVAASAALADLGIKHFCPIAITGLTADQAGVDKLDHEFWMSVDRPWVNHAGRLLIVKLDGWDQSRGIQMEIQLFQEMGKPIYAIDPKQICKRCDCGRNPSQGFAACECRSPLDSRRLPDQSSMHRELVERISEGQDHLRATIGNFAE